MTSPRLTVWSRVFYEKLVQAGLVEKFQPVLFADAAGMVWFRMTIIVVMVVVVVVMMMMMMMIVIIIMVIVME